MSPGWTEARRILCVRLDNLGDVLMTTPALHALRRSGPGRTLTLWASAASAPLAPHLEDVEAVIPYEAPWSKNGSRAGPTADLDMVRRLADGRFDAAVIFTVFSQNPLPAALLCRLAGIPLCRAYCRENPYRLLSDWSPETEPGQNPRHEVERQLALIEPVAGRPIDTRLRFALRPCDRLGADALLARLGLEAAEGYVVVHPGASAPSRRYPAEHFMRVVETLARRELPVLVTGSNAEADLVAAVASAGGARAHAVHAGMELGTFAALIERAAVLISNNTGPVHIAAALGTPVVDLYALTNPQHTPWEVAHRVLYHDVPCKYCFKSICPAGHHACLERVTPEQVIEAVDDLLLEQGTGALPNQLDVA